MKKALFLFVLLFQALGWSFESKTFNCEMTKFKSVDVFLEAEMQLEKNPVLRIEEKSRQWTLKIGNLNWNSATSEFRLRKQRRFLNSMWLQYSFWKNSLLEYQFEFNVYNQTANLYWWGTGRKSFMASFLCETP